MQSLLGRKAHTNTETNGDVDHGNGTIVQDEYGSTHLKQGPPQRENAHQRFDRLTSMSSTESSDLSFHDIKYTVNIKRGCCGKGTNKEILKNVNGIFKPGMNAVMGPTGSGKSSLLDVLAGRKEPVGLTGSILLDGMPPPENFKVLVGYVSQDDILSGMLTIRENLAFSAALRLPKCVSREERDERVSKVITELGLTAVADSKVGNEFVRGISGGERKRCNIGMELIISPPVLFLDEPTTGLDASTANAVMLLLKRMSSQGRNIIFAIHQPRYSIYRLFDSLMLLSLGQVVYHGPSMEAITFFKSVGFECDKFNNPADFFLDVINGDSTAITHMDKMIENRSDESFNGGIMEHHLNIEDGHQERLTDGYLASTYYKKLVTELKPIKENLDREVNAGNVVHFTRVDYKTSFFTQLMVVSNRAIKNLLRNPQVYMLQFMVIAIFAVIVGTVYFQINDSRTSAIQNRVGAFFFIVMNQVFGNMSAVELFIKERAIFIHENTSGFYRVSAFFLAKVFCDLIPMRLFPAAVFSAVAYYMIGLQTDVINFLLFALTLFLTALAASALSFLISCSVRIFAVANLCLALSYVFMMLFSGLLINVGDVLDWLSWIKYLSIFRYALNALNINELKDQRYCGNGTVEDGPPCVIPGTNTTVNCAYGNEYLRKQGIDFETSWDFWQNQVALLGMSFGFLIFGYIQLRRIKKLN